MKNILITAVAALMMIVTGCQKTIDEFSQEEVSLPDVLWVDQTDSTTEAARMFNTMQPSILTHDLAYDGEDDMRAEINENIEIEIPARAFEMNGSLVLRLNIKLEILILLKKGEWIRAGKTTAANNGRLLESHGIILARAWYNNTPIHIRQGIYLKFRYRYAGANADMKYYIPGLNDAFVPPFHFNWMPSELGKVTVVEIPRTSNTDPAKTGYMVESKRLGWMAVAKPAKVPERSAIVTVSLPNGFQNRNTQIYLLFMKHASLVSLHPDANNRLWYRRMVPVETPFMVVTITRHEGRYFLGLARTTENGINENKHFSIIPKQVSRDELLKFLNNL